METFIFFLVAKKSSVSRAQRFPYLRILCYVLERWIRTRRQILLGKKSWLGSRVYHNTELWTQLMVEPMELEWNIFPGFTTLQLCNKVHEFISKMSDPSEEVRGRIIFMSIFNDISWGSPDNEQERKLSANLVSIYARRFPAERWSFLGPGPEKKWYSTHDSRPQGF